MLYLSTCVHRRGGFVCNAMQCNVCVLLRISPPLAESSAAGRKQTAFGRRASHKYVYMYICVRVFYRRRKERARKVSSSLSLSIRMLFVFCAWGASVRVSYRLSYTDQAPGTACCCCFFFFFFYRDHDRYLFKGREGGREGGSERAKHNGRGAGKNACKEGGRGGGGGRGGCRG